MLIPITITVGTLIVGLVVRTILVKKRLERGIEEARQLFQLRREWLEAEFVSSASKLGSPRGLSWKNCDFDNEIVFCREPQSGKLNTALVGVTISFEAIEGGGMEDVEAVGNLRAATAVFQYDGEKWSTAGRAIFNLSPEETVEHFGELETVD